MAVSLLPSMSSRFSFGLALLSSFSHGSLILADPRIKEESNEESRRRSKRKRKRQSNIRERTEDAEIRHFRRHDNLNRLLDICDVGSVAARRQHRR